MHPKNLAADGLTVAKVEEEMLWNEETVATGCKSKPRG